jgi:hypothetical protein
VYYILELQKEAQGKKEREKMTGKEEARTETPEEVIARLEAENQALRAQVESSKKAVKPLSVQMNNMFDLTRVVKTTNIKYKDKYFPRVDVASKSIILEFVEPFKEK